LPAASSLLRLLLAPCQGVQCLHHSTGAPTWARGRAGLRPQHPVAALSGHACRALLHWMLPPAPLLAWAAAPRPRGAGTAAGWRSKALCSPSAPRLSQVQGQRTRCDLPACIVPAAAAACAAIHPHTPGWCMWCHPHLAAVTRGTWDRRCCAAVLGEGSCGRTCALRGQGQPSWHPGCAALWVRAHGGLCQPVSTAHRRPWSRAARRSPGRWSS
jgi:hypothetical protein